MRKKITRMYRALVFITPKSALERKLEHNRTLEDLHNLGFTEVRNVKVGKLIELSIEGTHLGTVRKQVREICQVILVNPVCEEFSCYVAREAEKQLIQCG